MSGQTQRPNDDEWTALLTIDTMPTKLEDLLSRNDAPPVDANALRFVALIGTTMLT